MLSAYEEDGPGDPTGMSRARAPSGELTDAEAEQRTEFERQLVGIVSHDIRNPLQAINLSAALGMKVLGDEQRMRHTLERIAGSATKALRMIDDLLDFTTARLSGGISVEPQPAELHGLVARAVEDEWASFPERQVELESAGDGRGLWDPERLAQVVRNLVSNALQHTLEGTPIRVESRGERDRVQISVHNAGEPIPREDLPQLFEPFQRDCNARPNGGRSLGLGLYITLHLVEAHGGTLDVRSHEGEGTTFTVELPRVSPKAGDSPQGLAPEQDRGRH